MKKSFRLLATAMMALLLTTGFTACSSDHDGIEPEIPIDPNNTVSINGEEYQLKSAQNDLLSFYCEDYLWLDFYTKEGKRIYMSIDRSLINKTTNLTKLKDFVYFYFDASDEDFVDSEYKDWEYISYPSEKVKKGTLTVTEIEEGKEYEISLEYVKNSRDGVSFADRTVKLHYKGKFNPYMPQYVYDYVTGTDIHINKVTYNAQTLKNNNAYDITIETSKGNWNVQFDASELGKEIDLTRVATTPTPCRIQASDSFGVHGFEFINCTHLGTFPTEASSAFFKVVKIKEGMFAIYIYYSTVDYFEISYVGEVKAI